MNISFHLMVAVLLVPGVGPGCVLFPRIDPLRFLAGCGRTRLNQGLVVALGFLSLLDRACFCVIFFGLWVHALFSSLSFCYQYQRNWLPGKIRPRNDLLCVEWDVKPCSTQLTSSCSAGQLSVTGQRVSHEPVHARLVWHSGSTFVSINEVNLRHPVITGMGDWH